MATNDAQILLLPCHRHSLEIEHLRFSHLLYGKVDDSFWRQFRNTALKAVLSSTHAPLLQCGAYSASQNSVVRSTIGNHAACWTVKTFGLKFITRCRKHSETVQLIVMFSKTINVRNIETLSVEDTLQSYCPKQRTM